jgi:hypothetical protein
VASVQKTQSSHGESRWVVRWRADGKDKERWFHKAKEAETFRRQVEALELQGTPFDPGRGAVLFGDYAEAWLAARRKVDGRPLAPRTRELYRYLLDHYVLPEFRQAQLSDVRAERVRSWHSRIAQTASPLQAAKAYRLTRTIFATAVDDGRVAVNPCRVRGGGVERSDERPFVAAEVVLSLAEAIEPQFQALALVAGFSGLRLGELLALRPRDIDVERGTVTVEVQAVDLIDGTRLITAPRVRPGAGRCTCRCSWWRLSHGTSRPSRPGTVAQPCSPAP